MQFIVIEESTQVHRVDRRDHDLAIRLGHGHAARQEHAYTRIYLKGLIQKLEVAEVQDLFRWIILPLLAAAVTSCGPEDWTNRLPYAGPVEIAVERGEFLPGTDIQYLGQTEQGARVLIGDAQASKEIGDSLDWRGEMVDQVSVDQTLRIIFFTEQTLQTAGTVRVIVTNPAPTTGPADVIAKCVSRSRPGDFAT